MGNNLKKKSKLIVIGESYWKRFKKKEHDEYISIEDVDYRRKQCLNCNYNSQNTDKGTLNLIEQGYNKIMGDYCTICKCPISSKVISPTEECALGQRGMRPLWNRTAVLTSSDSSLNLINLSSKKVNIDADKFSYIIYVEDVYADLSLKMGVESKEVINHIEYIRSTCPCIKVGEYEFDDNKIVFDFRIRYDQLPMDIFEKWIYIKFFTEKGREKRMSIKIIGKR